MANVQLPNINTAETDIKVLVPQLLNAYAKMTKELTFLLNNLDTRNLNYVDGDLLVEGTVTAAKLIVDELSAISANLGYITAGIIESIEIYGSYMSTRRNGYPKAEFNDSGDLVAVWTDEFNYVTIEPGITEEPTMTFRKAGAVSLVLGPAFGLTALLANVSLLVGTQNGSLTLKCGDGILDKVIVPTWSKFANSDTGQSLDAALNEKATLGASTEPAGGANAGIPIGTKLTVDGGGYVVWNGVPSHTHMQT
ncbi:hypothetical protein NSS79_15450 [Paenibacillus sp. FSL L8-0436]|uniref:hypothetical protein n=1 Tax=Paenibacillus sp. FSL L8-0436 TaxID=2954686 RepID=UPI0031591D04